MRDDGWRERWAPIELGALSELTGADTKVLIALAGLGFMNGEAWPGLKLLGEITGLSRSELIRSLKRLQEKGDVNGVPFIERVGPPQRGRGRTNTYRVRRGIHRAPKGAAPTPNPQAAPETPTELSPVKGARLEPFSPEKVPSPNRNPNACNRLQTEEKMYKKKDDVGDANRGDDTQTAGPCPACGGELRVRRNRDDGREFLGCTHYPSCRHTAPLPPRLQDLAIPNWGAPPPEPPGPLGEPLRDANRLRELRLAAMRGEIN